MKSSLVLASMLGANASSTSLHRRVAPGDFEELNSLFENAAIRIPETFQVNERVGVATLDMTITNLACFEISVGDVTVSHTLENNQVMTVDIQVSGLDLTCQMDYEYTYGVLQGDGSLLLETDNNSALSNLQFESTNFDISPPQDSSMEQCVADVEITRMDFEGDFVSNIIEVFQRLVRGVVERAIGNVACQELSSIGTTLVASIIDLANDKIEPYLGPQQDDLSDPLFVERNLELPSTLSPLLFLETENPVSKLFGQTLEALHLFLGAPISDETLGARNLVINTIIRDRFLDTSRAMVVNASQLPLDSQLFLDVHDRLFKTTMTLHQVKIFGLDTIASLEPFRQIGNLTLQNELTWSEFKVEFDVTLEMEPSSLDDAILQDPTSEGISERITMEFGVENVKVLASLLLVVDQDKVGSIELGSLLHTEEFLPCLLSVLHKTELVGLTVDPQQVQEPKLSGFISPGLDRILSDSASAAFAMYTGVLQGALPNIFQTSVRNFINDFVLESFLADRENVRCTPVTSIEGAIDFQEFFAGDLYGDIPPMLKSLLDSELLTADEQGSLQINQALIVPFTQRQSGKAGRLAMEGDFMTMYSQSVPSFGMKSMQLKGFDLQLDHLDSFVEPARLLDPLSAFVLGNTLQINNRSETLRVGFHGLFAMEGDPLLATHNDVYFSMSLAGAQIVADILAKMNADSFLTFPIRDLGNVDCWLATLVPPSNAEKGLSLESLLMDLPMLDFSMDCHNCTSGGLVDVLPAVLESLKSGGVMNVLETRLVEVGTEVLRSKYVQSYVDRLLVDSLRRCPHSAMFAADADSNEKQVTLVLTYDSLESLAFAATILMQISLVVVSESHQEYEDTDPLSAQIALGETFNSSLVNLSALNDTITEWSGSGMDRIHAYLNNVVDGGDLQINAMLRSSILTPEGALELEFNDLRLGGVDSEIALKRIRIMGLDSIEALNFIEILGPQTVQSEVRFKKLAMDVVVSLKGADTEGLKTSEDLVFSMELGEVDLSIALFLAISLDQLGKITLSSFMDLQNVVPCILSAAEDAKITKLRVNIGSVNKLDVAGFRNAALVQTAANSADIILGQYGAKIVSAIPGLFGNTVRPLINNWLSYMIQEWSSIACPSVQFELTKVTTFVDVRDLLLPATKALQFGGSGTSPYGDLFRSVISFIQNMIFKTDPTTGLSMANEVLVGPLTYAQSKKTGSLIFPGEILSSGTKLKVGGLDAIVDFKISDARVDNVDTLGSPLELLEAFRMPYQLNNTVSFGVHDDPLHFAVRLLVALTGDDDINVRNEIDITLDLYKLSVIVSSMLMIVESRFFQFPLRDVLDLNCWLATIPAPELNVQGTRIRESDISASLLELAAAVSRLNINVTCVECSSPKMVEFSQLISSMNAQDEVTLAVNDILEYVGKLAGGTFAQVQIDRILHDASRKCPHSPMYDAEYESPAYKAFETPESPLEVSYLIMLAGLAIGFVLIASLLIFGVRTVVRRRHKKWLGNLPPFQIRRLARNQIKERNAEAELNAATSSLFRSPEIPLLIRWFTPILILFNVALFLSGHFSLGATVDIEAQIAGENFKVENFFEFSIAKSTIAIWNAGGREIAIMILIFSGIWPYTKLFISLGMWFLPPTRVSVSRRGSILLWLDWLAKWSMVDVFVLVISIVAFRVSIASPTASFLPEGFYSIDMMVVPLWGLYANMIAQLVSQVSSHLVIYYHRRVVRSAEIAIAREKNKGVVPGMSYQIDAKFATGAHVAVDSMLLSREGDDEALHTKALREHKFSRPHRGETEALVVRRGVNSLFCIGAVCISVLVMVGCSIPSFSLQLLGIVGVAVEFGDGNEFEKVSVRHSIFSAVRLLMEEAQIIDSGSSFIGLLSLSLVFLTTVLVVPIVQSIALARQWLLPSTRRKLSRMAVFTEILQAWQYVEVYLVAVFVSSWQLGPISQYMINAYCENLKTAFAQAVHYGVLSEEDAQCFSVQLSIESGFFYLAGGAAILAVLATFVVKAYDQYFRDKDPSAKEALVVADTSDSGFTNTDSDDGEDQAVDAGFSARIEPVPVLFTDTFRWLLRADIAFPSNDHFGRGGEDWILPEARAIAYDKDVDGSVIQGEYLGNQDVDHYNDHDMATADKAKHQYPTASRTTSHRYPAAATARRQLAFDDEYSTMQGSIMDSVSSGSFESSGVRSLISTTGNLKDELTYATPPGGTSRMQSQPARVSASDSQNRPSLALSSGCDVSLSSKSKCHGSAPTSSTSTACEVNSLPSSYCSSKGVSNERRTIQELLDDEEQAFGTPTLPGDAQSEYMEETVDGEEFEEYTVKTMSEILEEDDIFEDYSEYDDQSQKFV